MFRFPFEELKAPPPSAFAVDTFIRFQDIDAAGILFFGRAFDYFHDTWVAFMRGAGLPIATVVEERRFGAPLRHAEADFLRPLRFDDPVRVELARAHVEETELTLGFRIVLGDGRPAVLGQTIHVWVEMGEGGLERRPLPAELRAALTRFQ